MAYRHHTCCRDDDAVVSCCIDCRSGDDGGDIYHANAFAARGLSTPAPALVEVSVDGVKVQVEPGTTVLQVCMTTLFSLPNKMSYLHHQFYGHYVASF